MSGVDSTQKFQVQNLEEIRKKKEKSKMNHNLTLGKIQNLNKELTPAERSLYSVLLPQERFGFCIECHKTLKEQIIALFP